MPHRRFRFRPSSLALTLGLALGVALTPSVWSGGARAADDPVIPWRLWELAGRSQGLDPFLLYSVALVESARPGGDGVRPWPWALRGKESWFPDSRAAAADRLRAILEEKPDVGPMQISLRWHADAVEHPERLLDPVVNLKVGARILAEALRSAPDDPVLAVGRYHSWDPMRARPYGARVLRVYQRLRQVYR